MNSTKRLEVYIEKHRVGTLALMPDHRVAFQYDAAWVKSGFSISPFSLPLDTEVHVPANMNCSGLFGVFEDSLPDAWGRLLVDRALGRNGVNPAKLNVLDRLALVGSDGMGDLEYRPSEMFDEQLNAELSLDEIQEQCDRILRAEDAEHLDSLFQMGGTSGGTRPKVYLNENGEEWLVKFQKSSDMKEMGKMEYDYSVCAGKCGILMSPTKLFPSKKCAGYFGTKRFDRLNGVRQHIVTVKGLLELPFDQPSLDYSSLLRMTDVLTNHNEEQIEQMFRIACFNVFGHNQDDHSKNFSFMYDKVSDLWKLTPAYDLTYSTTSYNEHTTSVNYNGKNPGKKELLAIAESNGIGRDTAGEIIEEIRDRVRTLLADT